jgi:hypothetical protein
MFSVRDDYIGYSETGEELVKVLDPYARNHLPGCGGSVNVVHVKWSNCLAGDVNRCTGKEGYPSLVF